MNKIKLSDYVADFIHRLGVDNVFLISGGGNMHLIDSIGRHKKLRYTCMHHEQALAMAAEGYARVRQSIGAIVLTTGPSGTNAITGVAGAWLDSTPMLVISGQVKTTNLIPSAGLRQFGVQELSIIDMVKPITKYAVMVVDPSKIKYELEKAANIATTPRFGPVWIDIPLDIQGAMIDEKSLKSFIPPKPSKPLNSLKNSVKQILSLLSKAKRPVLYAGHGIRLSSAHQNFLKLVDLLGIPVLTAWNGNDLVDSAHPLFMGRPGSFGQRHANLIMQNSDFFLAIGARLSIPQIGYEFDTFAREAVKIVVDIDKNELDKPSLKNFNLKIQADAGEFIRELFRQLSKDTGLESANWRVSRQGGPQPELRRPACQCLSMAMAGRGLGERRDEPRQLKNVRPVRDWLYYCNNLKQKYPIILPAYKKQKKYINSYYFVDILSYLLNKNDVIITDMGTSFTCTAQTFKVKLGQRFFTSSGLASMGFGLPGAIGAAIGSRRRTICISGDGGLQMNIQELQTIIHYNLNLKLFVLNNGAYLTIRETQRNFFNSNFVASSPDSGVTCPNIIKVAKAYGFKTKRLSNLNNLSNLIAQILSSPGPFVCEIMMDPNQALIPKLTSVINKEGRLESKPLEDMYPFLDRKEFNKVMIINKIKQAPLIN